MDSTHRSNPGPPQTPADWHAQFAAAHERYAPGLRRFFARRTGGDAEQVEELMQQTWTEAWKAVSEGRYRPEKAALSTFVYAVANKHWLRMRRALGSRRRAAGDVESYIAGWIDPDGGPEDLTAVSELLTALRQCIADAETAWALTPEELAVIRGLMDGLPERRLAQDLQVAPSTAHAWKRAALAKMRRCLAGKGFPHTEPGGRQSD